MIIENQNQLFQMSWDLSGKKSMLSGLPLSHHIIGSKRWFSLFAHLLSKANGRYPHFKLYLGNVYVLTEYEHHLLDHGDSDKRERYSDDIKENHKGKYIVEWDKLFLERDRLERMYTETFPEKVGTMIMKYDQDEVSQEIKRLNDIFLAS